ncbi:MAG: HesA/MoeB/ThiF family protein [Eggerthellaceae bacterium]|nr:HesA/MoeB/ThiF family protein [Eggerthellaceae bacterium]
MDFLNRYNRNFESISEAEQATLASAHVVVVGCGGLGGAVSEMLARVGVGHMRVVDADVFEESNLNRQLMATEDKLGKPKAQAAQERIARVNSAVEVDAREVFLDENNASQLLEGMDCVVDCLDSVGSRLWMAHAALHLGIPVVHGAIAGWFGQVCTVVPGDPSFATIYGAIEEGGEGVQKQLGNLVQTAWGTASFQVAEVLKVLLGRDGVLRNRLLMIDFLSGSAESIDLA